MAGENPGVAGMKHPLAPSLPDLILAFLLAAVLIIPWTLGRLLEKTWEDK